MSSRIKETEKVLKALANRRRLAIIQLLHTRQLVSVGDIGKEIGLSLKATSKHLNILHNANILEREQSSLHMFYSLHKPLPHIVKSALSTISNSRE